MEHFYLIPLIAGLVNLAITSLVLYSSPRHKLYRACAEWGACISVWNLGVYALCVVEDAHSARLWLMLTWVGVIMLPVTMLRFMELSFPRKPRTLKWPYLASVVVALFTLTPWAVTGMRHYECAWYGNATLLLKLVSVAFIPGILGMTLHLLYKVSKDRENPRRKQAGMMLWISVGYMIIGCSDLLPILGFDFYPGTDIVVRPWGSLGAAIYAVVVGHGIFSDSLIEMRISLGRNLATLLRVGFLITLCGLIFTAIGLAWPGHFSGQEILIALATVALACLVTIKFSPRLLLSPTESLEARWKGDRFDYLEKIDALRLELGQNPDLHDSLAKTCLGLRQTLGLASVQIVYRDGSGALRHIESGEGNDALKMPREDAMAARFETWLRAEQAGEAVKATETDDGEELCLALRAPGVAPVGFLRLTPEAGKRLRLHSQDHEKIGLLMVEIRHHIERDVIREAVSLRRANDAKDRFLAGINHEIRNPLNGLVGLVRMLRGGPNDGRTAHLVSLMSACTDQLSATMDNVLDFAHLAEGQAPLRAVPFELDALLHSIAAQHNLVGADRVLVRNPVGVRHLVGDAGKLRQILGNYVGNALKYGEPSRAEISVEEKASTAGAHRLVFTVTNSSTGQADENLTELFQPFRRGRRATETGAPGSGLGLSICQRLAQALGGDLGVRREMGCTHFWLEATFQTGTGNNVPELVRSSLALHLENSEKVNARVLAIEDEAYNRLVLAHELSGWPFEIEWAETGRDAEQLAGEGGFDLIIMDWLLPDTDGSRLLPRLRALSAKPAHVLVLSAYATSEKESEAIAAGAYRFLTKPIDESGLNQALQELFPKMLRNSFPPMDTAAPRDRFDGLSLARELEAMATTWRQDPPAAMRKVHSLRGISRGFLHGELPQVLADLERALETPANEAVIQANLEAAILLLSESSPHGSRPSIFSSS